VGAHAWNRFGWGVGASLNPAADAGDLELGLPVEGCEALITVNDRVAWANEQRQP